MPVGASTPCSPTSTTELSTTFSTSVENDSLVVPHVRASSWACRRHPGPLAGSLGPQCDDPPEARENLRIAAGHKLAPQSGESDIPLMHGASRPGTGSWEPMRGARGGCIGALRPHRPSTALRQLSTVRARRPQPGGGSCTSPSTAGENHIGVVPRGDPASRAPAPLSSAPPESLGESASLVHPPAPSGPLDGGSGLSRPARGGS